MAEPREMFRVLPWPFQDGDFPAALGAAVQLTVLDGSLPALVVEPAMRLGRREGCGHVTCPRAA